MCGIVGIIARPGHVVDPDALDRMTDALAHRGPDGRGTWINGSVGLGHRRLRIRGDAAQPYRGLTYNGEVYNAYQESDTKHVRRTLATRGARGLTDLNGMFALAYYDQRRRQILLARDRLGEKPLYYAQTSEAFLFASEAKALFEHPALTASPDEEGLAEYRAFQHTFGDRTLFHAVKRLEPGCFLVVTEQGEIAERGRYWQLPSPEEASGDVPELRALVEDAVRLRLRSDVPVGAYLSGGLDSSLVASLADVPMFHGYFTEPGYSEFAYARQITAGAKLYATCLTADQFIDSFEAIIWHLDEPTAGPGVFPQFFLSALARSQVGVCLGGQGGDELFAGYARHALIGGGPVPDGYEQLEADAYMAMVARGPVTPEVADTFRAAYLSSGQPTALARACAYDTRHSLPALLHVEDRVSMAHGLETRMPLLDHRIAEYVFRRPDSFRLLNGQLKGALRAVARGIVPDPIVDRRDKMGFPVPFNEWAHGPLRDWIGDLTGEDVQEAGVFDRQLWGRLSLAVWQTLYFKSRVMV